MPVRERPVMLALLVIAVGLRVLLAVDAPQPYGYVWDFYHEGVRVLYDRGRLPVASDCWQCYHPPLFYLLGWPFYAIGRWLAPGPDDAIALRWLSALPVICGAATVYYGYRLLRLFRCRGAALVLGLALLLTFPCLFISSYGIDADIVVTAILSAFIYYLTRDFAPGASPTPIAAVRLGVIAGLAAATKYTGLVGVGAALAVIGTQVAVGPRRASAVRDAVIVLVTCVLISGWKYADNYHWYGTPLHANGSAARGLSMTDGRTFAASYEFTTLRLGDLMTLVGPDAPAGTLSGLPVYRSVFTTLHALAWSDMSFFSEPSRHGDPAPPYPRKRTWPAVTRAVLLLGFVADVLAVVGFAVTLRRRLFRPLAITCGLSLTTYVWWFLAQQEWALKTKYVLYLLPPFVLYVVTGLAWVSRRAPAAAGTFIALLLALLIGLLHVYLFTFSVG